MKNEAQAQPEDALISLEGEDGKSYSCQLLNIVDFENQEYALLLKADENNGSENPPSEEGSLVIMRLIERDDQTIFQTIESDEEFERIVAHIESLAKQAQSPADPQEP